MERGHNRWGRTGGYTGCGAYALLCNSALRPVQIAPIRSCPLRNHACATCVRQLFLGGIACGNPRKRASMQTRVAHAPAAAFKRRHLPIYAEKIFGVKRTVRILQKPILLPAPQNAPCHARTRLKPLRLILVPLRGFAVFASRRFGNAGSRKAADIASHVADAPSPLGRGRLAKGARARGRGRGRTTGLPCPLWVLRGGASAAGGPREKPGAPARPVIPPRFLYGRAPAPPPWR